MPVLPDGEAASRTRADAGLGKLGGGVTVPAAPTREPVPDWIAARLIHTVGMAPHDVAALYGPG